jgi:hypothetical protein
MVKKKSFIFDGEYSERFIFIVLGLFFMFVGFYSIYFNFNYDDLSLIFWFCYVGSIVIGLGFIFKKNNLVVSQLNILLVPLFVWSVDFFYELFFGVPLWGFSSYFFEEGNFLRRLVILQHVYTIPISLFALMRKSYFSRNIWVISFLESLILFIFTRIFVQDENVNWVLNKFPGIITNYFLYVLLWIFGLFIFTYLTNFFLYKLFIQNKKSK